MINDMLEIAAAEALRVYDQPDRRKENHSWNITPFFNGELHVIAIAGTNEFRDWVLNAKVWPTKFPTGIWVHKGFAQVARSVFSKDMDYFMDLFKKPTNILLAGHSMGGSSIRLLHSLLQAIAPSEEAELRINSISFGSPALYFGGGIAPIDHLRVYHEDDPVPNVPALFYSHRDSRTFRLDDEGLTSVKDHDMNLYYKLIMGKDL